MNHSTRRRTLLLAGLGACGLATAARALAQAAAPSVPSPPAPPALMLAGRWRPGLPLADYWVSEKYDGVRGFWDGHQLVTRGGQVVNAPAWFTAGWPALPMDGELWAGRRAFEHAQATVTRQAPDDRAWRRMRFMVFDLPEHPGRFDERLPALQAAVQAADNPVLQAVAQRKLGTDAELQALLRDTVHGGGEGLMLHRGDSLYHAGRGDDLLKLKPFDDAEARVVSHLPGKGKYAGRLGALLVETPEGKRFRIGSGLTDAQRDHPPPVGSWITYRYRGVHEATGLPRFATFLRVRADEPRFQATR